MANPGAIRSASWNDFAASSYSKLWRYRTPRVKAAWAFGEPEVGKLIVPSLGVWARRPLVAPKTNATVDRRVLRLPAALLAACIAAIASASWPSLVLRRDSAWAGRTLGPVLARAAACSRWPLARRLTARWAFFCSTLCSRLDIGDRWAIHAHRGR